jgi:molybdate transport system regulatory protein
VKDVGLKTKIYLTDSRGDAFMGIGVVWLMRRVHSSGSLRKAAEEMHLSYAKAHRMIRDAEQGMGVQLLNRHRGGEERRGAELTGEALILLDSYEELQRGIKADAAARFEEFIRKTGDLSGEDRR